MRTRFNTWFARLSDQWRATLRTAWQSLVGGFLFIVLSLLTDVSEWVNGGDVEIVTELSNAARGVTLLVITFFTSLTTYYMNRGSHGATYVAEGE